MPSRSWQRLAGLAVVVVAISATALRLYHLTTPSLWNDEGGSLQESSAANFWAALTNLAHTLQGDHFQPLYFVLLYLWRTIAGSSVFSLRILSVLLGLAALAAIWAAAAYAFGRLHALVTATLVAVSAFFVLHAQEARPYPLLMLLGALLLLLFFRVRDKRLERAYPPEARALWTCFGIGVFASITVAIMVAGLALGDALVDRHPRRWLRTWLPCAAAALPSIGFYFMSSAAMDPRGAETTHLLGGSLLRNAVFAIYGIVAGTTYGPPLEQLHGPGATQLVLDYWPSLLVLAVATTTALVAVLVAMRRGDLSSDERSVSRVLVIALLTSFGLMFAFAYATRLNWQPRHSFFLALPLFLLLPLAIRGGRHGRSRLWQVLGFVALTLIALANVYSLGHYYWDDAYARDDYRAVAHYVTANEGSNRRSVLLYGYPNLLRYYGDRETIDGNGLRQDQLATTVRSATAGARQVLLISNREWAYWRQPEPIVTAMSTEYRFEGSVKYPYFTLYEFTLR